MPGDLQGEEMQADMQHTCLLFLTAFGAASQLVNETQLSTIDKFVTVSAWVCVIRKAELTGSVCRSASIVKWVKDALQW